MPRQYLDPTLGGVQLAIREAMRGKGVRVTSVTGNERQSVNVHCSFEVPALPIPPWSREETTSLVMRVTKESEGVYSHSITAVSGTRKLDLSDPASLDRLINSSTLLLAISRMGTLTVEDE